MSYMIGQISAGTKVKVTEYGGKSLIRMVVSDRGKSVVVCTEQEYINASRQDRTPIGVGFPKESVELVER